MAGLTLVGVGPGDPNLLTVAAVRAIEAATVVAYPVAQQGAEGMAARIASPWLKNQQSHRPLCFRWWQQRSRGKWRGITPQMSYQR